MRSVLFCNEMLGMGHIGLALALAEALADDGSTALVVTGSPGFAGLRIPERVDILKLPTAPVGADSSWSATDRRPAAGLAVPPADVAALRRELSLAAVTGMRPDVVFVDYKPLGREDDLRPTLEHLRERGDCVTALGMWEVDDAPERLRGTWTPALAKDVAAHYDLALVYGRPAADDVRIAALEEAGVPVHVTGVIGAPPAAGPSPDLGEGYLLATAGGGVDGVELFEALLACDLPLPAVFVTGPLMDEREIARLRARAEGRDVRVFASRPDMPALLAGARAVVAMAGYCTVAEILASGTPALLVPRAFPREEQLNRARRLAAEDRVAMLHPDDLDSLGAALGALLERPARPPAALPGAAEAAAILRHASVGCRG